MEHHAQEEYGHAEKIIEYLKDKDAKVVLSPIDINDNSWAGAEETEE